MRGLGTGVFFLLAWLVRPAPAAGGPAVKFNRDIRPIMSDTCFRCHGPDKSSRMMGLRLDIREQATARTKSGVVPIVPGDPDKSAIVQRIGATDPARLMPPKHSNKALTEAQKDTIRRWVAEGAVYEGHWSYQPVERPAVPGAGKTAARNAIDAFIQERLARERLTPSPEADRRTLLRRVTLDLWGVPPTPEEMAAFVADSSEGAYERAVDRLLASPRYAEMMTMHWLDAVRYADSAGFHGDNLWPAWPYRDWVLHAFRDNMPFDRFTRDQIAGDLIPGGTRAQKVASAFNRLNRASAEGGVQPKEYLAKYGADRVRTVSTVWLGSTMGCAECHDHKFDPFTSRDFYSMKAFFADIRETGLIPDRGRKAWGAKLFLTSREDEQRLAELNRLVEAVAAERFRKAGEDDERRWAWEDRTLAAYRAGELAWRYQRPAEASSRNGAELKIYNDEAIDSNFYLSGSLASERKRGDGLIVASGPNPDNETYTVRLRPGEGVWQGLGIDIWQDESLPGNRLSRGADRFVLTEVEAELEPGGKLAFRLASSTGFGQPQEHPAMAAIDGDPATGWGVSYGEHRNAFLALRFAGEVKTSRDSVLLVRLRHDSAFRRATIGRFRLALSSGVHSAADTGDSGSKSRLAKKLETESSTLAVAADKGVPPEVLRALETDAEDRTEEQTRLVIEHYGWAAPEWEELTVRLARLEAERDLFEASLPRVIYTERTKPRVTRVLGRGNFLDETGEVVEPAIPAFLGRLDAAGRATRLDLANWLVRSDNPLTARVFVNRLWRRFFGTGLSKSLEDLGSQGEWPTHPELLDWLAAEFMEPAAPGAHPWDVRHMVRTMVTSHTYRQGSATTKELEERDPANRLLARQSRFRVDAEVVHDTLLAVSGLLKERFGGPSVRPYQPAGYLAAMNFPKREYSASRGDDLYRRALYNEWQRTFLHPSLAAFDAPTREECTVNRVNSNTPLQALVLMNDPLYVEAARTFAAQIVRSGGAGWDSRLQWAFARALNRGPEKKEREVLRALYRKGLAGFRSGEDDAGRLLSVGESPAPAGNREEIAAWSVVARVILNLHETITRN